MASYSISEETIIVVKWEREQIYRATVFMER
jgi:hypothetical protein